MTTLQISLVVLFVILGVPTLYAMLWALKMAFNEKEWKESGRNYCIECKYAERRIKFDEKLIQKFEVPYCKIFQRFNIENELNPNFDCEHWKKK